MKTFEAENAWFTFKVDNPDLFEENWCNWDNYKSPISVIVPDVRNQLEVNIEESVVRAISDLSISVDKAELIRALQYDRGQYVMGFQDGWRAANEKIVHCKDCKHWHEETGWCAEHSCFIDSEGEACHPWESANWKMFDDNDFCSDGERKDNE